MKSGSRTVERWLWLPLTVVFSGVVPGVFANLGTRAQPITPAADGTGTTVTPSADEFTIEGGRVSSDGENLFHSFDRFNIDEGQRATFLANPQLENILGRIRGGEASIINGLLQVSGGSANLFLMNPAGIIFGPSATLNVPADFTATTATGIGFGGGHWFDAVSDGNWELLVGAPTGFNFATAEVGAIANFGILSVPAGGQLSLIGGSILNTGELHAPGGNVSVAGVTGETWVRLSAPGNLLDLEVVVNPETPLSPGTGAIDPLSLPQLLAGGRDISEASQVAIHPDGTLSLVGSPVPIQSQPGTTIVSGTIDVSNDSSPLATPPVLQILGDRVALLDATLDASGIGGGGNIFIGGDFGGQGILPNARVTFVDADTSIFADALQQGDGGRVILWADDTTQFFGNINARGASLSIGNILSSDLPLPNSNGGFVEVSGRNHLVFDGIVDVSAASGVWGTLLLDPENILITRTPVEEIDQEEMDVGEMVDSTDPEGEIFFGDVSDLTVLDAAILENQVAQVRVEATNDITIAPGVSLSFVPDGGAIAFVADSDADSMGSFSMDAGESIATPGRNIEISGAEIVAGTIDTSSTTGDAGGISLTSTQGDVTTQDLVAVSEAEGATGGAISLMAEDGTIAIGDVTSNSGAGNGGAISLRTASSDITTGDLFSQAAEMAGSIEIETGLGAISTGNLNTASISGDGGAIALTTESGNIFAADIVATGANDGGNIDIISGGAIEIPGRIIGLASNNGSNLTLEAIGNITLGASESSPILLGGFVEDGGNISIESEGEINLFGAVFTAANGVGGNVIVRGDGEVTIGTIDARSLSLSGGRISIESSERLSLLGNLETNQNQIILNAPTEIERDVSISVTEPDNLEPAIQLMNTVDGAFDLSLIVDGGTVSLSGAIGSQIPLSNLEIQAETLSDINPVEITTTGNINLQNITANSGIILSSDNGNIVANILNTSHPENSGNILLHARDIQLSQINTQSPAGVGGNVEISAANFFQATGAFVDVNGIAASISTAGSLGGGSIVIRHGGDGIFPFTLGDGTTNGTTGAITRGSEPEESLNPIASYLFTQVRNGGQLQIVSIDEPISINDPPAPDNPDADVPPNLQDPPLESDPPLEIDDPNPEINPDPNPDENLGIDDGENLETDNPEASIEDIVSNPSENDRDLGNPDPPDLPLEENPIDPVPEPNLNPPDIDEGNASEPDVTPFPEELPEPSPETELEPIRAPEPIPETGLEPEPNPIESPEPFPATGLEPELDPIESPDPFPETGLEPESDPAGSPEPNLDVDWSVTFNPATDSEVDLDVLPESVPATTLTLAWRIAELLNGEFSIGANTDAEAIALTWTIPEADRGISLRLPYLETPEEVVWSLPPTDSTVALTPEIPEEEPLLEVEVTPEPPSDDRPPEIPSPTPSSVPSELTSRRSPEDDRATTPRTPTTPDRSVTPDVPAADHPEVREDPPEVERPSVVEAEAIEPEEPPTDLTHTQPPTWAVRNEPGVVTRQEITENLASDDPQRTEKAVTQIDRLFATEFEAYLEEREDGTHNAVRDISVETMRNALNTIETQTAKKSAIIYALTLPKSQLSNSHAGHGEQLNLVLVVPEGPPIVKTVDLERHRLRNTVRIFLNNLNSPRSDSYLPLAQELYHWLVRPLEEELASLGIDTLIFSMDAGLRQVPLAALHDGRQFLVERYSIGSVPSLSLTNTQYKTVRDARVLAMGASEFPHSDGEPLPAVPSELSLLIGDVVRDFSQETDRSQKSDLLPENASVPGLWPGRAFLNEAFTLENLIARRQEQNFSIVHLATHAQFDPARRHEAYIQLWDDRLSLDGLRQAQWYAPPLVELLVLSACETAVGDEYAELGFAGLAVRSGAKSALASLWKVSDMGSLALMSQFYRYLKEAPIKAEALRQAQLRMLRGDVFVADGQLAIAPDFGVPLPPEVGNWDGRNFSHPYYWAGFAMVGSPW